MLARGAWLSADLTFAVKCARLLQLNLPESPVGDYVSAMLILKQGGDAASVKELFQKALTKGSADTRDRETVTERREALESLGVAPYDARIKSLFGPIAFEAGDKLRETAQLLKSSSDPGLIAGGIALTQHCFNDSKNSIQTQLSAIVAQMDLLPLLPQDYEFGESGLTISSRQIQASEALRALHYALKDFNDISQSLTESEKTSWADKVMTSGELAATLAFTGKQ